MDFQNLAHKAKIKILLYGTCKIRANDAAIANVVQRFIQRTQRFVRNQPSGNSAQLGAEQTPSIQGTARDSGTGASARLGSTR